MEDFSGLSPRVTLFSAMDDFSGDYLINPTVDSRFTHVTGGEIHVHRYVQIGAGSIVFPALSIGEGSVIGALSLVNRSVDEWGIYAGIPVRFLTERQQGLLNFVQALQ